MAVTLKACCGFARAAQDAREELMGSASGPTSSRSALAQVDGELLEALKSELASLEAEASHLRQLLDEAKSGLRGQKEMEEAFRRQTLELEMAWDERAAKEREEALAKLEEVLRKEAMCVSAFLEAANQPVGHSFPPGFVCRVFCCAREVVSGLDFMVMWGGCRPTSEDLHAAHGMGLADLKSFEFPPRVLGQGERNKAGAEAAEEARGEVEFDHFESHMSLLFSG